MPQQKRSSSSASLHAKRNKTDEKLGDLALTLDSNTLTNSVFKDILIAENSITKIENLENKQKEFDATKDNLIKDVEELKKVDFLKILENEISTLKNEV